MECLYLHMFNLSIHTFELKKKKIKTNEEMIKIVLLDMFKDIRNYTFGNV